MDSSLIKEYHKTLKALHFDMNNFFGRMDAFEMVLEEEHEKAGETDKELGMYRYKGMQQYGNIVSFEPTYKTMDIIVNEFKWSDKWITELIDWYEIRNTFDTITLYHYMKIWKTSI